MKWLTYLLVILQVNPLYGASIPIGVAHIGNYRVEDEKAYAILERRIQRWIENNDVIQIEAKSIGIPLSQEDVLSEVNRLTFKRLTEEIRADLRNKTDLKKIEPKISRMRDLRKRYISIFELNPLVQNSLVLEGLYFWNKKDFKAAELSLRRAAKLHPESVLLSPFNWDTIASGNDSLAGFEALLSKAANVQVRSCHILLKGEKEAMTDVYVNGFKLGKKKELHLNSGSLYRLSRGVDFEQTMVRCERQSNLSLVLPLQKTVKPAGINSILKKEGVSSAFVVQSDKAGFKLGLFTPGVAFDDLLLETELKKSDILQNATEEGLPLSKQSFIKLIEKHRLASLQMRSLLPAGHPNPINRLEHPLEQKRAWYNHWAFWAITGTVLTGAAIAYFASQKENEVGVSNKTQMNITFE